MKRLSIILLGLFIFVACESEEKMHYDSEKSEVSRAVALIHPLGDSGVMGTVEFTSTESGVQVSAEVTGLMGQKHGFHIHEFGDCTSPDGTSTGGHFNPKGMEHGAPELLDRHMGAMGNIEVNEEGIGIRDYVDKVIVLEEIIGRGVIIHGGEDDLTSQPSGDSGPRIACGVIGVGK